jgi:putative acyl-CoA dehydrogenase
MRLARALDRAADDPGEAVYARLMTPVAKFQICKLAPAFMYEAMECLGGNGYVEESILPRLYREAPVNAIWEGSGNVMCLDVLRALTHEAGATEVIAQLSRDVSVNISNLDSASEAAARAIVGRIALLASAAALKATAPSAVAEAFVRTRLADPHRSFYGSAEIDTVAVDALLERALPEH